MSAGGAALVTALVVLGMVVVLPLGLRLLGAPTVPGARSAAWPAAGLCGAVSLVLPHGPAAVASAAVFAGATLVLLVAAVRVALGAVRAGRRDAPLVLGDGDPGAEDVRDPGLGDRAVVAATVVALAAPAVGACALVAERGGWGLLGFSGTYLALTVPHMLYAGFGAALVAGSVARLAPDRPARAGAWGVPVGTLLVLGGYFVGDVAELVGAVVLTLALWATALATARALRAPGTPRPARWLLGTGAATVAASMVLALWWAVGEATGVPHPGLDVMAATHGVANALGFVLCSVLGLRLLGREDARRQEAGSGAARGRPAGTGVQDGPAGTLPAGDTRRSA